MGGSFELEQARRIAAEDHCEELEAALVSSSISLLPIVDPSELPPLLAVVAKRAGGLSNPCPLLQLEHLEAHRLLHMERRRHAEEMRDLTTLFSEELQGHMVDAETEFCVAL